MRKELFESIVCPYCKNQVDIYDSHILCKNCNISFNIINGVPQLVPNLSKEERKTKVVFSFIWDYFLEKLIKTVEKNGEEHANIRDNINIIKKFSHFQFPKGDFGLDVGCGVGYDLEKLAIANPDLKLFGVDITSGVYHAFNRSLKHKNIHVVQANALYLPFRGNFFDFVYSFGVVHHTSSPDLCFKEIIRVTKQRGLIAIFVLKDLSDHKIKKMILPLINLTRKITTRLSFPVLFILSLFLSVPVYIFFVIPAKVLLKFKTTKKIALKFPFWFGINFINVISSMLDRLGASYEYRFNKKDLTKWCRENNLTDFSINDCSNEGFSGWLISAIK